MGLYGEEQFRRQYENCRKIIDRENGSKIQVETPAITCVNREYVKDIAMRANRDIDAGEYDSAITNVLSAGIAYESKNETAQSAGYAPHPCDGDGTAAYHINAQPIWKKRVPRAYRSAGSCNLK